MNTARRFPRTLKDAFGEHYESCYGVETMPVIRCRPPRILSRLVAGVAAVLAVAAVLMVWP